MNEILLKKKEIHRKLFQGEIINKYKITKELNEENKEVYKIEEEEYFNEIFNKTTIEEFKGFYQEIRHYCKTISFFIHSDTNKGKYSAKELEDLTDFNIILSDQITCLVGIDYDPEENFFYSINSNKNNFKSDNLKDLEVLLKIVHFNLNKYKTEKETIIYNNPGFENVSFLKKILIFSDDNKKFLIPNIVLFNLLNIISDIKRTNIDEKSFI